MKCRGESNVFEANGEENMPKGQTLRRRFGLLGSLTIFGFVFGSKRIGEAARWGRRRRIYIKIDPRVLQG